MSGKEVLGKQVTLGNTGPRSMRWAYTSFHLTLPNLDESMAYHCRQLEYTQDKKIHWQGYIRFKSSMRLSTLVKKFPKVHWERTCGSESQNIAYCSKKEEGPSYQPASRVVCAPGHSGPANEACTETLGGGGAPPRPRGGGFTY